MSSNHRPSKNRPKPGASPDLAVTGLSDSTGAARNAARETDADIMGSDLSLTQEAGLSGPTLQESGVRHPAPKGAGELSLSVEIGGEVVSVQEFRPDEVTVGRRPRNDITIDGAGLKVVSGYHMRFAVQNGEWCVEDRNSTNGTFLNGLRVDGSRPIRSGDVVELGRPQKRSGHQTVRLGVVIDRPSRPVQTSVVAAVGETLSANYTLPAPRKMPAVQPVPRRAILEEIQAKSCELGELRFKLDAYVADLASAVVERHASIGVAQTPGGAALIELIARRDGLDRGLGELESDIPSMRARLGDQLRPLEAEAASTRVARDVSETALKSALQFSKTADARFLESLTAATSGLLGGLESLKGAVLAGEESPFLQPDNVPAPGSGPLLGEWAAALRAGIHDVERNQGELETLRGAALGARRSLAAAQGEFDVANSAWAKARAEADARRDSVELMVSQTENSLATSGEEITAIQEALGAAAEEFVLGVLTRPESMSASLANLAGMDEARELYAKSGALQRELEALEERAS